MNINVNYDDPSWAELIINFNNKTFTVSIRSTGYLFDLFLYAGYREAFLTLEENVSLDEILDIVEKVIVNPYNC